MFSVQKIIHSSMLEKVLWSKTSVIFHDLGIPLFCVKNNVDKEYTFMPKNMFLSLFE